MIFVDDRTEEEKKTHRLAVVGTDTFMSGWGQAEGGVSYAGWAFTPAQESKAITRIESRGDMKRVRVVMLDGYRPSGVGHCHIYVYRD
ncbi:hypothetical protein CMI37_28760 [Candidatus Pacearchaeota archaeon]|nr:hypothetical protein [Candidatus Pacearchaeota archaeon]